MKNKAVSFDGALSDDVLDLFLEGHAKTNEDLEREVLQRLQTFISREHRHITGCILGVYVGEMLVHVGVAGSWNPRQRLARVLRGIELDVRQRGWSITLVPCAGGPTNQELEEQYIPWG